MLRLPTLTLHAKSILAALATILGVAAGMYADTPSVNSSLDDLDSYLLDRELYISQRNKRIDSLKTNLQLLDRGEPMWFAAMDEISEAYSAFNNDSLLNCYNTAMEVAAGQGNDSLRISFKLKILAHLPLTGNISETVSDFESIDTTGFSKDMQILYLDNARQMFNYISAFHRSNPAVAQKWKSREMVAKRKLMELLPPESPKYQYCQAEYLFQTGQYEQSKEVSLKLLEKISPESNLYARVCHNLADIASLQGNESERIYYLTRSAVTDILTATLEVTSLQELGVYLFNHNDLSRAYTYLYVALENAVNCHAPLRVLEISETLPLIERAHYTQNRTSYRLLLYLLIAACLLLLLLAVTLVVLKRQFNRKTTLQNRLEGANLTKEIYLSQFLILCSSYVDKLNSFNQLVKRKISAGKVDDLYKLSKSSRFMEEQSKEFYEVFDNAFLHIYPTFVEEVNKLLLPDKKILLEENERLNTDLRILALMRLGMEDTNRVAHMLNYSVNTIYAYRNRLRNRAINRDSFEADIMKISSI
ncbi:MAG: hypothetical protein K2O00_07975 [Muribaculaceae bacterium]|nr:hypothetical protein [Muribaculaceae bacterium]